MSNKAKPCVNNQLNTSSSFRSKLFQSIPCACLDSSDTARSSTTVSEHMTDAPVPEFDVEGKHSQHSDVREKKERLDRCPPFSNIKEHKTPVGKVKIYFTDILDDTEEARIMMESIKLLKYVREEDKKC